MYDFAASTASPFQLAWAWLTPPTASACENLSPYGDSSWWIRPAREKLPKLRYDLADSRASRWPAEANALPATTVEVAASTASRTKNFFIRSASRMVLI